MDYDNASSAEQEAFHAGARECQNLVWSYVVPVRVARIENDAESTYNTGTGTLLRLQDTHLLLTAWHVFEELLSSRSRGQEAVFIAGNAALEPPLVAYSDRANDIVVLTVPDEEVPRLGAVAYEPGPRWPPRRVTTEDIVLLCGLPAFLRTESAESEILFGDFSVLQTTASVGEHQFVLHLDRDEWVSLGRVPMPDVDVFLGGLSGAPVFVLDRLSLQLVGIVSEIGESIPLLYAKSLAHLPPVFNIASEGPA